MKAENGVVLIVRYEQVIARIDRDAGRIAQTAEVQLGGRRRTAGYLPNSILQSVADVQIAALVDREAHRKIESIDLFARARGALRVDQDIARPGGRAARH